MKQLSEILSDVKTLSVKGNRDVMAGDVTFDSRKVKAGSLFVAVKGTHTDGHDYIPAVISAGAVVVVCERLPETLDPKVTYVQVADTSFALGQIASAWYDNPSSNLKLVGITGTNGKTTTVTLLFNLFREAGYHAGLLSTISNRIDDEEIASTHTTPDAVELNSLLSQMVDRGCDYCFMEVSSHSIVQNRIAGLTFAGGIFSNITHDHLDFHVTFDEYLKAKKRFFDELPSGAFALTNLDDRNGRVMLQNTQALKKSYSLMTMADFKGRIIETPLDGLHLEIDGKEIWCRLVGQFNAYNILAVYSAAVLLGEEPFDVLTILSRLGSVEGRFDYMKSSDGIIAIVDYAHTPDALQNVLDTISNLRTGNETLITVVGCGGDRDRTKRPIMAQIAGRMSDKVIITSDNPRSEEPEAIISEMLAGIEGEYSRKVIKITDRREAIKTACAMARPGDVILVAGKGHEKYQEINGVRHHFDDKEQLREFLQ
ncbi:MAG TPA: UDP-N-acetylmuramoyl-L-alanyl-D-glutamate--2,6-diaminopimelate ligase [Bacteroidales bacterium]|nr:UDP-N-acetylmuramoyl-L-alanyl-D-glutamate--2,6-diaminopimelate ligase [Bacteroidales bacterium]HPT02749.1 UDP-N-acetylmuramoyl-L-alanyl-D-glutamate--2,6-diaminopimelate ligase [Bacteroidales bacterium]